ncbi:hypothetical protein ACH5RR_025776 [Cinchona calisaya]|uniref:Uncharacterized protein n=1 Tax=Cinchona calisaya TaxID=153742 RepID=A0ABD2Z0L5_9GENT
MQMKRNEEMESKKEYERKRKKELERQKAERARKYEEHDWAKLEEVEEEEIEESKKHKENVAELRAEFSEVDEEYEESGADRVWEEEEDGIDVKDCGFLSANDEVDELKDQFRSKADIREDDHEMQPSEQDGFVGIDTGSSLKTKCHEMESDDDESGILEAMVSRSKNQKNIGLTQKPKWASKKAQVKVDSDEMDFMEYNKLKGSRRNRGGRKQKG